METQNLRFLARTADEGASTGVSSVGIEHTVAPILVAWPRGTAVSWSASVCITRTSVEVPPAGRGIAAEAPSSDAIAFFVAAVGGRRTFALVVEILCRDLVEFVVVLRIGSAAIISVPASQLIVRKQGALQLEEYTASIAGFILSPGPDGTCEMRGELVFEDVFQLQIILHGVPKDSHEALCGLRTGFLFAVESCDPAAVGAFGHRGAAGIELVERGLECHSGAMGTDLAGRDIETPPESRPQLQVSIGADFKGVWFFR